jgi:ubiquinone/menaquinone biosynthesis C-methylase UbiE
MDNGIKAAHISPSEEFDVENKRPALNIWRAMNKGMTVDSFLGNDLSIMKKLHRSMEYPLIFSNIPNNSTILDIGAGRGANIMHWKQKHLEVYAVEPNKSNYLILEKKIKLYHNLKFLNAYGQDSNKILKFIGDKKMDVVIMIYSLTFFFETEKILDNFVDLVNKSLKPNGLFLGTVMDGHRLLAKADKKGIFDCPPFTIKIENKTKKKTLISQKVFINIDDKVSLVKNQTEYLVDFDLLQKKLKKKHIYLEKTGFVGSTKDNILNECPRQFTKMMRWFIFKKSK